MDSAELPKQKIWPAWSAPVALLTAIISAGVFAIPVLNIADRIGISVYKHTGKHRLEHLTTQGTLVASFVQDICFIAVPLVIAMIFVRPKLSQFGLRRTKLKPAIGWFFAVLVFVLVIGAITSLFINQPSKDPTVTKLTAHQSLPLVITAVAFMAVVAPISEEFLFRGFLFTALRGKFGALGAAAMTGIIFGAIHLTNYSDQSHALAVGATIYLACLGFALAMLYYKTQSLYPAIAFHVTNNCYVLAGTLEWSGAKTLFALICCNLAWVIMLLTLNRKTEEQLIT